jgi:hypothetical protein
MKLPKGKLWNDLVMEKRKMAFIGQHTVKRQAELGSNAQCDCINTVLALA